MPSDLACVPFLEQYFGFWLFEESRFWSQFDLLSKCDVHLHLASDKPGEAQSAARKPAETSGKTAVIQLNGKMMKQASSSGGTSTVAVRRQIRAAMASPDIANVALHIDSPGGTAAGTQDLADDVAALAKVKPVLAYIEDLGASAAYWVASQATHIATNRSGLVGSIGTYGVVYDMSGAAAMQGIKAYVIRAGEFKGSGTPGTEVTQEQLADMQRTVSDLNAHFISAVATGRGMSSSDVTSLADGRVHVGKEAMSIGLVDSVESFDAAFSRLQSMTVASKKGGRLMLADHITPESTEPTNKETIVMADIIAPTVATSKEIKAACPGCDADFVLSQLESSATMADVKDAWIERLTKANADATAKAEAAEAEKAALATQLSAASERPRKPGVAPVGADVTAGTTDDPIAAFNDAVKANEARGMKRQAAMSAVIAADPDLHQSYLTEYRENVRRKIA